MNNECLRLDRQLCFPLYACAKEIVRKYDPILKEIGLTYTQYIVMLVLWEKDGVSAKELGQKLLLDSGTLTPVLAKLAEKGLVELTKSEKDGRSTLIRLTWKGEGLEAQAAEVPAKIGKCIGLAPEEGRELGRLLYKVLAALAE